MIPVIFGISTKSEGIKTLQDCQILGACSSCLGFYFVKSVLCGLIVFRKKQINKVRSFVCLFYERYQIWIAVLRVFPGVPRPTLEEYLDLAEPTCFWFDCTHLFCLFVFRLTLKSLCSLLIHLRNLCYSPPPHILPLILTYLRLQYLLSCWFLRAPSLSFLGSVCKGLVVLSRSKPVFPQTVKWEAFLCPVWPYLCEYLAGFMSCEPVWYVG